MPQSNRNDRAISTAPEEFPAQKVKRARTERRIVLVILIAFLAAGLAGLFGPKTRVVTATAGGYRLTVTYPSVTRPGLPIRWEILVDHPGGFRDKIHIATTFDYFHLFDVTGIEPDITSSSSDGKTIVFEFEPPAGDVFRVQFDAAVEPGAHELPRTTTSLLVGGRSVVHVSYSTRVMP